jgi:diguanylate cyclase (GGDEF)-like protein
VETYFRIDLNVFCFVFAAVLFVSSRDRKGKPFLDYRLFMIMLGATMFQIGVDVATLLLDGRAGPAYRALLVGASTVYYIAHPIAPLCFALYSIYTLTGSAGTVKRLLPFFLLPALGSAAVSAVSPLAGWFFRIDSANVYSRGPLFPIFAAVSYFYFAFAFVFTILRRRSVDRRTFVSLLVFSVPPAIAGYIQALHYGLILIWPSILLSMLEIYVNIQQRKLSSDYLTGASNRRRLDEYLATRIREACEPRSGRLLFSSKRVLAGLLVDVDDLKSINDNYGRPAGDEALVKTARLLRQGLRSEDFLARYADDEFVAVLPLSNGAELSRLIGGIRRRFEDERSSGSNYPLSISIGAAVYDPALDPSADAFIGRLDDLMYREKEDHKARRSSM